MVGGVVSGAVGGESELEVTVEGGASAVDDDNLTFPGPEHELTVVTSSINANPGIIVVMGRGDLLLGLGLMRSIICLFVRGIMDIIGARGSAETAFQVVLSAWIHGL